VVLIFEGISPASTLISEQGPPLADQDNIKIAAEASCHRLALFVLFRQMPIVEGPGTLAAHLATYGLGFI
jgi:hypothetical protein